MRSLHPVVLYIASSSFHSPVIVRSLQAELMIVAERSSIELASDTENLTTGAKYLYIATFFFDGTICFPKLSALFFYTRIFQDHSYVFTIHLWIAGALTTTLYECRPLAKAWKSTLPGPCIDTYTWCLATAILPSKKLQAPRPLPFLF
ncbi:hypothetical protein BDV12DRAFT_198435 [Aspergillus spectabilis]